MLLARVICSILALALGGVLAGIAFQGISRGFIKPFRMGRWGEPEEVYRQDSSLEFWSWIIGYFAFSAAALVISILGLLGKIKLR